MKLAHRRQFLHLAAGAAALPAVSCIARAQGYPARPGDLDRLRSRLGVERRFLDQVSRTPFDCQAISLPPLANNVSSSAPHVRRPADD